MTDARQGQGRPETGEDAPTVTRLTLPVRSGYVRDLHLRVALWIDDNRDVFHVAESGGITGQIMKKWAPDPATPAVDVPLVLEVRDGQVAEAHRRIAAWIDENTDILAVTSEHRTGIMKK